MSEPGRAPNVDQFDEVTLRGMRFHALIGVLDHERTIPQPLEIDLSAWIPAGSPLLDYRRMYDLVSGVVTAGATEYLEVVAERVAAAALQLANVHRVRVAVRKPHVALPGPLQHAEVVIVRARGA